MGRTVGLSEIWAQWDMSGIIPGLWDGKDSGTE